MIFHQLEIAGAFRIELEPRGDHRGFFARAFSADVFEERGLRAQYPQANLSLNHARGTLRGIHYRDDGHEAKLVRCIAGMAHHVVLDLRRESPTYLRHQAVQLSRDNRHMLYIPEGCGHGLQALRDDTELLYMMSDPYIPEQDKGVRWDDPAFGITWPLPPANMSERDMNFPDHPVAASEARA